MTYYVAGTGRGKVAPYEVRRNGPYSPIDGVVKSFVASVEDNAKWQWGRVEPDHQVRVRAQAFCDRLNAGGASRERALREAQPRGTGR